MPQIETVVETAVYAEDLEACEVFYTQVLRLERLAKQPGRHVFFRAGPASVVLIFRPEASRGGGALPPHGATGSGHLAFGVAADSWDAWHQWLAEKAVSIEHEHQWPSGGRSLYLRDPAGNSVELLTPGVWGLPAGW